MTRPLRQDAARRRADILEAARAVFAESGLEAPLDLIAERAGVGRATLYRNFADRYVLALAVFVDQLEQLAERTRARGDDPQAFFAFIEDLADLQVRNAGLAAALRAPSSAEMLARLRRTLVEAGGPPLARAQAAGLVRPDLGPEDVRVIALLLSSAANASGVDPQAMSERARMIVLEGLRTRP
jgi:AcrR family transcriptional regulator